MHPLLSLPVLVTAQLDSESFEKLTTLRTKYFPKERNYLSAHVTLFHKLPPLPFVQEDLAALAKESPEMPLRFGALRRLSGGMAVTMDCPKLDEARRELANRWQEHLSPQDRAPFRAHATLMNKATREAAEEAFEELQSTWVSWQGTATGFQLWRYRNGPWEPIATFHSQRCGLTL